MKRNNILYLLLIVLIIMNGFFLFNYMGSSNNDRPREPQRNKNFIVKELGFDAAQLEQFKEKSKGHHETMIRLSDDIKVLKDNLFGKLSDDSIKESTIDSISSLICEKEKQKDKEVFSHFKMIQDLSNEKQKEKFKSILKDALRQGDLGDRPPPPNVDDEHRPPPQHD